MILTEFQASQLARAAADIAGYLLGATIDLIQTPMFGILPTTPLATFTAQLANYTGYAQHTITWDAPSLDGAGNVECVGSASVFRPSGTTVGNMIWGCIVCQLTVGTLLFAGVLDGQPIPMQSALNQCQVQIVYRPATNSFTVTVV